MIQGWLAVDVIMVDSSKKTNNLLAGLKLNLRDLSHVTEKHNKLRRFIYFHKD